MIASFINDENCESNLATRTQEVIMIFCILVEARQTIQTIYGSSPARIVRMSNIILPEHRKS